MEEAGYGDASSSARIKRLWSLLLIGTPEATLVTIVETVMKLQKQGLLLSTILPAIENHRKRSGTNSYEFSRILELVSGSADEAGSAVGLYVFYRLNIEHPGRVSIEQCVNMIEHCVAEINTW